MSNRRERRRAAARQEAGDAPSPGDLRSVAEIEARIGEALVGHAITAINLLTDVEGREPLDDVGMVIAIMRTMVAGATNLARGEGAQERCKQILEQAASIVCLSREELSARTADLMKKMEN